MAARGGPLLATLAAAALAPRAWGLLRLASDSQARRFIVRPAPDDIGSITQNLPSLDGMVPTWMQNPLANNTEKVMVMAYHAEEDKHISGNLTTGSPWETRQQRFICEQFRKINRGNFLDVGANIGTYALPLAACLRGKGKVFAVEGMPRIADHLRAGIFANNFHNVFLYPYAIGGKTSQDTVTMSESPDNKGGSAVAGDKPISMIADIGHEGGIMNFNVPLTNLDAMVQHSPELKNLLVAKVDIEGHEGHFIAGAQELLSTYPPCMLGIELIPRWLKMAGTPLEDVLAKLEGFGYTVPTKEQVMNKLHQLNWFHQTDTIGCFRRVKNSA